ncbi:hypothetical protein F5050DRAFT_1897535 [Lentinula boryana]|uniref:HMG box domain-containing protein n=1 Tax=Lentinula boryana TaxID=40481 RepID=A0ABQ8Q312_9AGAR|nr:hypothetical protein F5050DRAFT_1897535 [Lentinula boryana]
MVNLDDCPNIKFFTLRDWTEYKDGKKSIGRSFHSLAFLQLESGEYTSNDVSRLRQMTAAARGIWTMFYSLYLDAETWTKHPSHVAEYFYSKMAQDFEEFHYCNDGKWKAKQLAIVKFPDWSKDLREKGLLERDPAIESRSSITKQSPSERPHKKQKVSKICSKKILSSLEAPASNPCLLNTPASSLHLLDTPASNPHSLDTPAPDSDSHSLDLLGLNSDPGSLNTPVSNSDGSLSTPVSHSNSHSPNLPALNSDPLLLTTTTPNPDSNVLNIPAPNLSLLSSLTSEMSAPTANSSSPSTPSLSIPNPQPSSSSAHPSSCPATSSTSTDSFIPSLSTSSSRQVDPLTSIAIARTVPTPTELEFTSTLIPKAVAVTKSKSTKISKDKPMVLPQDAALTGRNIFAAEYLKTNQPTLREFTEVWQSLSKDKHNEWNRKANALKSERAKKRLPEKENKGTAVL